MTLISMLAQSVPDPRGSWLPVAILIVIAALFVSSTIIMSLIVGPRRTGPVKESTYESGMVPVGDARRRFNVRFYLVAMIFLVFDVEIVFLYPFATLFPEAVSQHYPTATLLLAEVLIFIALLLVAYLYAWGKGVFRWD